MIKKEQYNSFFTTEAKEYELEYLGLVPLSEESDFGHLEQWLSEGKHGEMKYLNSNLHCRKDPRELLDGSTASAVFAMPYSEDKSVEVKYQPSIAKYARLKDYHKVLKQSGLKILKISEINLGIIMKVAF